MKKRWEVAQQSEISFWEESFSDEQKFREMCLKFYPIYNDILLRNGLDNFISVCDIGSGPYSCLIPIKSSYKYAVDPLMDYFKIKVGYDFYYEHNIEPVHASGEDLPFFSGHFDLVCCLNTLDHAENPEKVMEEANRVLKEEGYLLLSVNHYDWPIVLYRRFLELIGFGDRNHPNTYHFRDIIRMIVVNGFNIIDCKKGDTKESKKKIDEAGGTISISLSQRISRAMKTKGLWYVIKQAIASPGHFIINRLFKTYPDSVILCRKIKC